MIQSYLNQAGYRVTRAPWQLYNALVRATLTLTGLLPAVPFRCSVRPYAVAGHSDCAGSVVVGSETLTFTAAARKTTAIALSALPVVTTSGLDCNLEILAVDVAGQVLLIETQTALDCRFRNSQKRFQDEKGDWVLSQATAITDDPACEIGTIFSYGGYDYQISQMSAAADIGGDEVFRKLYLTAKTLAPTGRATTEESDMLTSVYDTDNDGVVDGAKGLQVFQEVPTNLDSFEDGAMFVVGKKIYRVRSE